MTQASQIREHRERGRGRRAFWILAAVGLAVILTGAVRSSQRGEGAPGHRRGAHQELSVERIQKLFSEDSWWLDRMGIAEEQRRRIAALLEGAAPRLEAMSAERDNLRREMIQAFSGPTTDSEQIEELRWKAAEITVRALDEGFDLAVELADVLTPEQRRNLVEHWEEGR